jgi:hypothetical protein
MPYLERVVDRLVPGKQAVNLNSRITNVLVISFTNYVCLEWFKTRPATVLP